MKIAFILLLVAAALLGYALTLSPYKNEELFRERYMKMSAGMSEEYWRLREEMLTPKFQLEDYGITAATMAAAAFFLFRKGRARLQSPQSRKTLVALALVLPLLTVGGYVFDLLQGSHRGEFPHWADSLGIPLAGVPVQFVILLIWSLAHLAFLRGTCHRSTPVVRAVSRKTNLWLLFVSAVTAVFVLLSAAAGQYWYAIPGAFWLYYYLSLGAIRRRVRVRDQIPEGIHLG